MAVNSRAWRAFAVCAPIVATLLLPVAAIAQNARFPDAALSAETAKEPIPSSFDYSITIYGPKEGAPEVIDITQTPDGFLWLATSRGLVRFDGSRFQLDERIRKYVAHVAADKYGAIYVAYQFGGVGRIINGHYEDLSAGLPQATAQLFTFDTTGNVWVTTTAGVFELKDHRWLAIGSANGIPDNEQVSTLGTFKDGSIWMVDAHVPRKAWLKSPSTNQFQAIDSRDLWLPIFGVASNDVPADLVPSFDLLLSSHNSPSAFARDRANIMWRFSSDRVGRFYVKNDHDKRELINENEVAGMPPPQESRFYGMFADREGNIWLNKANGLWRVSVNRLRAVAPRGSISSPALARGKKGDVWIGPYFGRNFYHYSEGVLGSLRKQPERVTALTVDSSDRLWIFNFSSFRSETAFNHVDLVAPSGTISRIDYPTTLSRVPIAFAEDPSGGYLLSSGSGFYRYLNGAWTSGSGRIELPNPSPLRLIPDNKGHLWLGWPDGDVAVIDATKSTVFPGKEVSLGAIYAIWPGAKRTWLGGDDGVALVASDHVRQLWPGADNPFKMVTGIVETERGELWINTADGVYRLDHGGVANLLAGRLPGPGALELFNDEDGLQGASNNFAPGPSLIEGGDGRIWISRREGVNWIDPGHMDRNTVPAQAHVDRVDADNRRLAMIGGAMRIPPNTHNLRIVYTAPSLTMPDRVTFQYRLSGIDKDWQVVGNQRFALYTDPPPGNYTFEVLEFNEDGVSTGLPARAAISVTPAWYQTWWCRVLCILAATILALFLYTRHLHRTREELRLRLQAKHEERDRIARELHDTLMQSMQGMTLKLHAWSLDNKQDPTRAEEMRRVSEAANDELAEGRDRILDLRRTAESSPRLTEALRQASEKLVLLYPKNLTFEESGQLAALQDDAFGDIFQVGKEGMRNALLHAHAQSVAVSIHYGLRALTLVIADDGIGLPDFVAETGLREGHWGLIGMRERALRLHGTLSLGKRDPHGTELRLVVPGHVAYVGWLPRLWKAAFDRHPGPLST